MGEPRGGVLEHEDSRLEFDVTEDAKVLPLNEQIVDHGPFVMKPGLHRRCPGDWSQDPDRRGHHHERVHADYKAV